MASTIIPPPIINKTLLVLNTTSVVFNARGIVIPIGTGRSPKIDRRNYIFERSYLYGYFYFIFFVKEQKERPSQRITLGLQGVGLSLVNNEKSIEVAYIGIRP